MEKENKDRKVLDFQEKYVSLQHGERTYHNRRAEGVASADEVAERNERLGLHSLTERGRATLANRWDILVYEEGLQSQRPDDLLGSSRVAIFNESNRLIEVAKQYGEFIPSTVWETFGLKNQKPSGESVVFFDEKNDRVVKFKDPFSYIALKEDNPYNALYEHHIHNHFFENTRYRFLGVSQDPVSKGVRFVFEQPYIHASAKPSKGEIEEWLRDKDFKLVKDGFWFSDSFVSFTDIEGDNCIKDINGELYFIDPIIKFEKEPKLVIEHYIQKDYVLRGKIPPQIQQAIIERVSNPSARAFTKEQRQALDDYCLCFPEATAKGQIFNRIMDKLQGYFDKQGVCREWVNDARSELNDISQGVIREDIGIKY